MPSERARALREGRRKSQFAKFALVQLNLIPLVDTFVAIVFFSLTAATVGELAPILNGERTMGYDLLQRLLQSARMAGFQKITLQVRRATEQGSAKTVTM